MILLTPVKLTVKTFGSFTISRQIGEDVLKISESDNYSRKLWGFLQYMVGYQILYYD